ncbi:hypothetical protein CANCADRAFT_538 [Tortispora caseinolytica NRRL Y-17796]|uniref:5-oxoprolinase n=1 Tax=Tortispora caseinolytica NRRL Y-17796 TaxID=767744 RepID=A0A1E4TJP7_9ASCO|nr:hypothetical protein CANCADRAFT_538 [Tortispora caseinolytica NRRL Y-17796]
MIRIAIDRGGTFTDCIATKEGEPDFVLKLLSVDPSNYDDAPREAIRRVLEHFTHRSISRHDKLDTSEIESIRMGTTVATNALLERKGERCALLVTKGFKDLLEIGDQSRPDIFDLEIRKPEVLYEKVIEIDERVILVDYAEDPLKVKTTATDGLVEGVTGETVKVLQAPDLKQVRSILTQLKQENINSIAVCFMHSYTFPDHEKQVAQVAEELHIPYITMSSKLMPMIKIVPRANSAVADAYLTPEIEKYTKGFISGFTGLLGVGSSTRCEFMQSDGGLVDMSSVSGLRAILSGPAGGVVGYALTSFDEDVRKPVIGFDMGGTSTDVSRFGDGKFEHVFETTTAGITIQSPQLDINTVAAGGGSRLFWQNGLFVVGPESAGAHPGPACYRKGGPLTVTDANLVLGRLVPELFPKIFGPNENEGLDIAASLSAFEKLTATINNDMRAQGLAEKSIHEVALGFIKVANEAMARPIRTLTESKGYDIPSHRLATFGGAGGQHAVAIARSLGISEVLVHKYSSILSAYGMALADVVEENQEPSSGVYSDETASHYDERLKYLCALGEKSLLAQGFDKRHIEHELYLNMRYKGAESALMIGQPPAGTSYAEAFIERHRNEFGFIFPGKDVIVDDIRVRSIGKAEYRKEKSADKQLESMSFKEVDSALATKVADVFFDSGLAKTPIYYLSDLSKGTVIRGPAIVADNTQTILIEPASSAHVLETCVYITLKERNAKQGVTVSDKIEIDPVLLSIFGHRFMAIAEQMGRSLRKTAVSTNVKERLDYSCALFDADGGLVANAPHVPVHLGSMSTAVRTQAEIWRGKLEPGDVIVSNHPNTGGTHLPDVTVISPSFYNGKILFYVASRAHHADIGGILPGSMPPSSKELYEEGAALLSEKIVHKGKFDEDRIRELFLEEPAKYPGCSGSRRFADNLSDLKAQIAANHKGIALLDGLMHEYGLTTVSSYMKAIQENAELAVRKLLKKVAAERGNELVAEDYMDDGTVIKLKITISEDADMLGAKKAAVFDFAGTGLQVYGNTNAPVAVTYSAIIYCLRCLISLDIPLNQGCLSAIEVRIPPGSLLSPGEGAAVVGGNVMTSQRITDVILKAFDACAASQGDCNNLTFGVPANKEKGLDGWGYYETIGGGAGAGPHWQGADGVHTHMTNTRMTDSEIMERRYPVIVEEFGLRKGSGGSGKFPGGCGIRRRLRFMQRDDETVICSILSERRVNQPYGLHGGGPGSRGLNLWIRGSDNRSVSLGGRNTVNIQPGDIVEINTPGGGGYGIASD